MAKLHKVEMYILDTNEEYSSLKDIIDSLEYRTGLNLKCFNHKETSFKWDDNLKINYSDATIEDYEECFKKYQIARAVDMGSWNNPRYSIGIIKECDNYDEAVKWINEQPSWLQRQLGIKEVK